jgi:hypothetical protein
MAITQAQEEFVSRFRAYMAKAGAYDSLAQYVKGLGPRDLRDCLSKYFDVSKDYLGKEERKRSLRVFFDVSLLALQKNDQYFALRFEALTQFPNSAWQKTYSGLESTEQRKLSAQVGQQKTRFSVPQRRFLDEFDRHMRQPNQKAVSNFTSKFKKSDQLFDLLLVYVETSQKYADDDKNSLIVFFGVSYQALEFADSYFAANYESLVTSEGTVWKRRFDALDHWQRDEMLKPAIAEKKKITIEKKGIVKDRKTGAEKEVAAQEKYTVPALAHVSPDLEGPRPTPPATDNQRRFVADFKRFMDSNAKPAEFTDKIFKLSGPELVECVEAYLQASLRYRDDDVRSLYIFFGTASLAIRKADAYYSFRFAAGIATKGTLLAKRFEALNGNQKAELEKDIQIKKKQARVLDDLKIAYFQKEKKEPTPQALRDFEAVNNPEQFSLLWSNLENCNRTFNLFRADDFSTAFDKLSTFVQEKKDLLLFVTLLKRCREEKRVGETLRHQLYWYMAGILYLQAVRARPEAYRTGFSNAEKQFLFDAGDAADSYFSDFVILLDYLWLHNMGDAQFTKMAKGHAQVLLFAAKTGVRLVPMVEMAAVRGLVEKLEKEKPQVIQGIRIPINSRDQGKTLRIYQTIGDRIFIVWWQPNLGVYIEHVGLEGLLFRASDSYNWLGRVHDDDAIWGEVYRSTAHILVIMPFIFELLGYLPDLVTGGVTGLAKAIFFNLVIDKTVEELGLNSNAVQLALLGAGLLTHHVFSEKKAPVPSGAGTETLELERATAGALKDNNGARNRGIDPPAGSGAGAGHGGNQGRMTDYDPRGIAVRDGNIIGVHEPPPFDTLTADHHVDSGLGGGGTAGGSTGKTGSSPNVAPATRQDLALAEEHLWEVEQRFKASADTLENAKKRAGDIEDLINEPTGKANLDKLKENHAKAEANVVAARERYKKQKYELRAAESRVDRLTKDLASRGDLEPKLRIDWNLPDKPTKFRYKSVETKSWRPDGYVGTTDDRRIIERILKEDPQGELGKRLLRNGELYPANVGDMNYWKVHPELIEMAHVLSKREGGREVYMVMTKARNQTFSANLERTGGVFKEDAIVIQGIAIDRLSAIQLGVPQSVIDRAPTITFTK